MKSFLNYSQQQCWYLLWVHVVTKLSQNPIPFLWINYQRKRTQYFRLPQQAFLKELCICVHGEDLRGRFGPYKLSPEIAISFNGDICEVLNRTISRLETASTVEFQTISQGFARKLIRTYYSMVMARSQIWSTRLHEQSQIFLYHFPYKKTIISTLLEWIEQPPTDRTSVIDIITREGLWACENFVREAHILT